MLIRYPDDGDGLWHERVLLAQIAGQEWVTTSPDYDLEEVNLGAVPTRVMGEGRRLPIGIREGDCYSISGPGMWCLSWWPRAAPWPRADAQRAASAARRHPQSRPARPPAEDSPESR